MHPSQTRCVAPASRLSGEVAVPGDKSISHRSIMFASLAEGTTRVTGLLRGEDCLSTLKAFQQLGIQVEDKSADELIIHGRGLDGLQEAGGCDRLRQLGNDHAPDERDSFRPTVLLGADR